MIAKRIDETVRFGLAKVLKAEGFRKSGRTFHVRCDAVIRVVNVQASASNLGDAGKLTLNLGVYFPVVAELLGKVPLPLPKEYECTLRVRIGELMDAGNDQWWAIEEETDMQSLGNQIAERYAEVGKPWLDTVSTLPGLLHALADHRAITLEAAAAAMACGDPNLTRDLLSRCIAESRPGATGLRENARACAARWGVKVE